MNEERTDVEKTPAEFYNASLNKIILEVDLLKQEMVTFEPAIVNLAERLESWSVKIFNKMNETEQTKLEELLKEIRTTKIKKKVYVDSYGNRTKIITPRSKPRMDLDYTVYPNYKSLLEDFEIFLLSVMERNGLTNPTKTKTTRAT